MVYLIIGLVGEGIAPQTGALCLERVMTDTRIAPTGSQGQWEIMRRDNYQTIGHIQQAGKTFDIVPIPNTVLSGVCSGPYSSKEEAVSAIELHTSGICTAFGR